MKTSRFLFILFISFLLCGCIKEALMLDTLKGKWFLDNDESLVTTTEDVSFLDLYSKPWTGTVTVNGVVQDCSPVITTMMGTYFYINPDIQLFPSTPKIAYKHKFYDSSINWDIIATGNINKELTITDNNNTINIKIDLKAPTTNLKKGVEYAINDVRWENDMPITDLEFLSPTRITGYVLVGDINTPFNGNWFSGLSDITLKLNSDFLSSKISQSYKYIYNRQELTLYKYIDFYKVNYTGRIPYEKISKVKQVRKYVREDYRKID